MRKSAQIIPLRPPEARQATAPPRAKAGPARILPGGLSGAQFEWLQRGLAQPGGKLPLFGPDGRRVDPRTVRACVDLGYAEPWFANPTKPDWLVCRLTESGRALLTRT